MTSTPEEIRHLMQEARGEQDSEGVERKLVVWAKPETGETVALFTVSVEDARSAGPHQRSRALCVDAGRTEALRVIEEFLMDLADGTEY